jgi:hypothetical protein
VFVIDGLNGNNGNIGSAPQDVRAYCKCLLGNGSNIFFKTKACQSFSLSKQLHFRSITGFTSTCGGARFGLPAVRGKDSLEELRFDEV